MQGLVGVMPAQGGDGPPKPVHGPIADKTSAVTAVGAIGGLTLVLASLLVVANRKLYVQEDPRIDAVEEMLPHSNCGACG